MMHYKRRLIPVNLLDIPAVETWLADLAEKGLFLVSSGNYFAKFETAEPAKVTYRLEVTADPFLRADPDKKNTVFSGIWLGIPESFPMVSLAEIEQDPAFQNGHIDDANTTYVSGDVDNEIRFRRSFLAPEQTTITQSGFVPGRNWAGSSDPYEPTLSFRIYRLRCPSMGGRFVESQMDWELSDLMPWDTIDLSAETGLDEAYLCVSGKYSNALKKLFLRQGDSIIYVSYFGEADLRPFVPQFAALMQETYPTRKPQ